MYTSPYYSPAIKIQADAKTSMAQAQQHLKGLTEGVGKDFLGDFDYETAISGALGLAGQYAQTANQDLDLGQAPILQSSSTGEPMYNLGEFYNQVAGTRPQGAGGSEVLGAVGQGAASGGAVGGVPGAVIGGTIGLATSVLGGERRRNKQQREKQRVLEQVKKGQESFNKASQSYEERQLGYQDYQDRRNINDRLYNLYNT